MFDRVKSFAKRIGNKLKYGAAIVSAAVGTAIMSVVASAEEETSTMQSVITSTGATLKSEFTNLVSTLVPVITSIAVVGLTIYAIIYLFKMAKKLFAKAAG